MSSRFSHSSSATKMVIVIGFILVAYLIYALTRNIYNNYQMDKHIEEFRAENEAIELENKQKAEDYLYFTSEEYVDKIAKQNWNLVNPGEEVIILSEDILSDDAELTEEELPEFARVSAMSVSEQWWNFFFGD